MSKNNANGKAVDSFIEKSCLRAESSEHTTNNITATLLYAYPMGMVSTVMDIRNIRSRLPGAKPILFSKAFLEKL